MFFNAKLQNAYNVETLQKQFNDDGIKKTVLEIVGYIVLAMNKYNTDWTIYIIKTEEDKDELVYVSDEDYLEVSTDYKDLFKHYLNQAGAERFMINFEKFLVYYEILDEMPEH